MRKFRKGSKVSFKGTFHVSIPNYLHPVTRNEIPEEHIFTTPELEFTYILTDPECWTESKFVRGAETDVTTLMDDPNFLVALEPLMQECCDHIAQKANMSEQVQLWVKLGLGIGAGCTLNGEDVEYATWETYSEGDKLMNVWSRI